MNVTAQVPNVPLCCPAISYDLCHAASWSPYDLQMCELSYLFSRDKEHPHGRLENSCQRDLHWSRHAEGMGLNVAAFTFDRH